MIENEMPDFMGLNNFVWWFGVVENRLDPLNLGRCKVRAFGWHTDSKIDISVDDLPWAHPVVPYGGNAVQPPVEGTMVFGFFADGKEGKYPIIMGTVPGIPEEQLGPNNGFADPYTDAEKGQGTNPVFPRRVGESKVNINAAGPTVTDNFATRYPDRLNEPTVSRLARPTRIESETTGKALGVRSGSISGTTIDFQRKNRITNITSAKFETKTYEEKDKVKDSKTGKETEVSKNPKSFKKRRIQAVWNEPFPSYNAKYPFNHVQETESGHAFEMDDTPDFERVQISHRTGSTLEFMPSGSIKEKSFKDKYNIIMGNERTYINGAKDQTVQSDMFLKINGELVIQCNGLRLESGGDINISGYNVKITAQKNLDMHGSARANISGLGIVNVRSEGHLRLYGGYTAGLHSGGVTSLNSTPSIPSPALITLLKTVHGIELGTPPTPLNSGVVVGGPNFWTETLLSTFNSAVTNILPSVSFSPSWPDDAGRAGKLNPPVVKYRPTKPTFKKEETDKLGFFEKDKVRLASQGTST